MKYTIGDILPDLNVTTHKNSETTLLSLCTEEKNVFWVLRYIGCTVCRYDVHTIAQHYSQFKAKNAKVTVIMQSDPAHVQNDLKNTDTELPFDIICDPDFTVYNALSIEAAETKEELVGTCLDTLKEKGAKARALGFVHGDYEGNELQLPAMIITDRTGRIIYIHYASNLMDMPVVDEVLELL